jgi:Flp pilus assembly protein TadD
MYFMKYSLVADHWQYVSLIGVIGLVVGLASHAGTLWGAGQRKLAGVTGVAVLGALGLLTWTESRAYGDSEALWKKTVSENPRAWIAQGSLGMALTERGQTKAALEHFSRALRSEPHDAKTHNNMGIALGLEGRFSEASAHFEESLGLKPDQAEVHNNLGYALAQQGKLVGAVVHYRAALRLAPEDARVHKNLADALARLGEASEAIRAYRHALYRRPDWPEAMDRLARILATHHDARLRSGTQAVRLAEQACELTQRRNASFLDTLAAAYAEKGRFSEAVKTAQEAQELAAASGKKDLAETIGKRLLLYRSNQPSHEAPPAVTP